MDPYKSSLESCIHPKVLKELAKEISEPILKKIFQYSIDHGSIPTQWGYATVTPIHKGGNRHAAKNYRPISITSTLCRCLEKLIKSKVMDHLLSDNNISTHQHGFIKYKSCLTNLLETMEDLTSYHEKGIPVDEVFLDFAKAFDKVPHQRLLYKLNKYGVCEELLCWIESFLCHRKQRVRVGKSYSQYSQVTSGVPQGSTHHVNSPCCF